MVTYMRPKIKITQPKNTPTIWKSIHTCPGSEPLRVHQNARRDPVVEESVACWSGLVIIFLARVNVAKKGLELRNSTRQ